MAVKRYDGSAWQVVAGKGDQGTSSSISTWVKTASGGETSLSGNDDNSQALSYTVGQELVFINGTLLKRGSDYTATNGTSITGLTALAANDVATVWTVNAFSVTGAIANTIVDAKGDILVGTAADTPGRLAVGTNGQVLTAASTTGTGLQWSTPASGAISSWTLLNTGGTALTGATKVTVTFSAQKQLLIVVAGASSANVADVFVRLNDDSATKYSAGNFGIRVTTNTTNFAADSGGGANYFGNERISIGRMGNNTAATVGSILKVESADSTGWKYYSWMGGGSNEGSYDNAYIYSGQGIYDNSTAITSVSINSSSGNLDAGTVYVLGGN
jgi:hypothetical protein